LICSQGVEFQSAAGELMGVDSLQIDRLGESTIDLELSVRFAAEERKRVDRKLFSSGGAPVRSLQKSSRLRAPNRRQPLRSSDDLHRVPGRSGIACQPKGPAHCLASLARYLSARFYGRIGSPRWVPGVTVHASAST
jgi:hypothetical protein